MTNQILSVEVRNHSVVAAAAEVHVSVTPRHRDPGTEVRGRLMGPRCRFASTVEVAYHLRPLAGSTTTDLTLRAVIPEASLWEPQTPHLYHGVVELWQDGRREQVAQLRHGLRHLVVGTGGVRINGRRLEVRGREVEGLDEGTALGLREAGYNLVIVPAREELATAWEVGDSVGLLVVGRVEGVVTERLQARLAGHASHLGWLPGVGEQIAAGTTVEWVELERLGKID